MSRVLIRNQFNALVRWRYPQYSPLIVPQSSEQPDVGLVSQRISTQDPINSREIEYLHWAIKTSRVHILTHIFPFLLPIHYLGLRVQTGTIYDKMCVCVCTEFFCFGIRREQKTISASYNFGWEIFRKPARVMIPLTISGDPA